MYNDYEPANHDGGGDIHEQASTSGYVRTAYIYDGTNHELKCNGPEIKNVRMKTSNDLNHADVGVDEQAACERERQARDGMCH